MDEPQLAADLSEFAFDYADVALKDLKIGMLLHRVSAILREHAIVLPADLTLLFKALITLEGLGGIRSRVPPGRAHPAVLDRALSERYQPAEALRRADASDPSAW